MFSIFKWIVYTNIWIAFSVVSLIFYGSQIGLFELSYEYNCIAFFATLFAYNFQRIEKSKNNNPNLSERHVWINNHLVAIKFITVFSLIITVALSLIYLPFKMILIAVILSVLVLFYAGNQWLKLSLRRISYLKIFLIASVWTVVVAIFPCFISSSNIGNENYVFALMIFLFISILCIPFDIRDLKTDEGLVKTIPSYLGIFTSKLLSVLMLLVLVFLGWYLGWIVFSIVSFISAIAIVFVNENRNELFYTGLIDGLMLLFPLLQLLLEL